MIIESPRFAPRPLDGVPGPNTIFTGAWLFGVPVSNGIGYDDKHGLLETVDDVRYSCSCVKEAKKVVDSLCYIISI